MVFQDESRIAEFSIYLRKQVRWLGGIVPTPLNFYSVTLPDGTDLVLDDMYPELHNPGAVDFFAFVTLQNHGFWIGDDDGYVEPLVGVWNGKPAKGSDLLWRMLRQQLRQDPTSFEPERLASIKKDEFRRMLTDHTGNPVDFPDFDERYLLTRKFGRWLISQNTDMSRIVFYANRELRPLSAFMSAMSNAPGFDDWLEKKVVLLAMTLEARPERFLRTSSDDNWPPIVDYHLMRLALRIGLVKLSPAEAEVNSRRIWVSLYTENMIRAAVFDATANVLSQSGLSMQELDFLLWSGRKFCPEMEAPNCPKCPFEPVCEKRIELFQPVFRTSNY